MSASIWAPGSELVVVDAESTNLSQVFTASAGQTVFTLTAFSYTVGGESVAVYRGGQRLIKGVDWVEISSTSITVQGITLAAGETIEVVAVLGAASDASIAAAASAASAATSAASILINPATEAIVVQDAAKTGATKLTVGTTAQRPSSPVYGDTRINSTLNQAEWWNGSAWVPMGGGATGAPGNYVFVETDITVTGDYTITSGKNALTAGPITINNGVTVTVPNGSVWSVI